MQSIGTFLSLFKLVPDTVTFSQEFAVSHRIFHLYCTLYNYIILLNDVIDFKYVESMFCKYLISQELIKTGAWVNLNVGLFKLSVFVVAQVN